MNTAKYLLQRFGQAHMTYIDGLSSKETPADRINEQAIFDARIDLGNFVANLLKNRPDIQNKKFCGRVLLRDGGEILKPYRFAPDGGDVTATLAFYPSPAGDVEQDAYGRLYKRGNSKAMTDEQASHVAGDWMLTIYGRTFPRPTGQEDQPVIYCAA